MCYCGSKQGTTNAILSLINHQQILMKFICILKIHLNQNINLSYIKVKKSYGMYLNELKTVIEYLIGMNDFCKHIDESKTQNY